MPTEAKPHPATSLYLKAPKATKDIPINIIVYVAQANTVFLFIAIIKIFRETNIVNLIGTFLAFLKSYGNLNK